MEVDDLEHHLYFQQPDYNDWVDENVVVDLTLPDGRKVVPRPSRALFCGDNPAYMQGLEAYRTERLNSALGARALPGDQSADNLRHFHRLLPLVRKQQVVPFVGAGMSASCGYPTWSAYIEHQLTRIGYEPDGAAQAVSTRDYEELVDEIVSYGLGVFERRFLDEFGGEPEISGAAKLLPRLFNDVVVTTNYDNLLERIYKESATPFNNQLNGVGDSAALHIGALQ